MSSHADDIADLNRRLAEAQANAAIAAAAAAEQRRLDRVALQRLVDEAAAAAQQRLQDQEAMQEQVAALVRQAIANAPVQPNEASAPSSSSISSNSSSNSDEFQLTPLSDDKPTSFHGAKNMKVYI